MRNITKLFSLNFIYILLIAGEMSAIVFLCLYLPSFMPVAVVFTAVWFITVLTVMTVVCRNGSPEINLSLALFVTAIPIAGSIIYLVMKSASKKCGLLEITSPPPLSGLSRACYSACGTCETGYDRAIYLKSGEDYFPRLFKEIEKAQKSVYLEYFIISRGKIFTRLTSALRTAKKRGADIKIIIDGVGSAFKAGRKEIKKLKATGAEVKVFHKLSPVNCSRLNFRDHRKIAVIDGKTAFIGGFNIADEYANVNSPLGYWKDTGCVIYGSSAKVFEGMFLSVWNGKHEMQYPEGGKHTCLPYYDSPPDKAGFCENAYTSAISSAKERVHIFTPYFCASEKIASTLKFAAERKVDVRIIIPHIPDKGYAFELSKTYALPLIESGVKFYEFTPGFMHAKSMVCDNRLFIGSYNLDFRSMRLNFECGAVFKDEMCECAERDFWECIRLSSPLGKEKLSRPRKVYRFFLKLFAPLM